MNTTPSSVTLSLLADPSAGTLVRPGAPLFVTAGDTVPVAVAGVDWIDAPSLLTLSLYLAGDPAPLCSATGFEASSGAEGGLLLPGGLPVAGPRISALADSALIGPGRPVTAVLVLHLPGTTLGQAVLPLYWGPNIGQDVDPSESSGPSDPSDPSDSSWSSGYPSESSDSSGESWTPSAPGYGWRTYYASPSPGLTLVADPNDYSTWNGTGTQGTAELVVQLETPSTLRWTLTGTLGGQTVSQQWITGFSPIQLPATGTPYLVRDDVYPEDESSDSSSAG